MTPRLPAHRPDAINVRYSVPTGYAAGWPHVAGPPRQPLGGFRRRPRPYLAGSGSYALAF